MTAAVVEAALARPGFAAARLVRLMRAAVRRCELDLAGRVVLTEAATGAYAVTPVLAALAGAQAYAVARNTRYGSAAEVAALTRELAALAGVPDRVEVVPAKTAQLLGRADIVTNSGNVRPIDAWTVSCLRPGAAVPLMYESWELRPSDVDLVACRARGVRVAGTNERHPGVDVFSYLGVMAVKLLLDAGVAVYGSELLVLCDNPFRPFLERGLAAAGAALTVLSTVDAVPAGRDFDAVLVAQTPRPGPVFGADLAQRIAARLPGVLIAQYWGDVDRAACVEAGLPVWPPAEPPAGHMAVLPSAVGPEPVVRLQAGGLKVGELLCRGDLTAAEQEWLQPI